MSGSSSVSPQRPFFDPFQLEQAKVEYLDNKDEHHEGEDEEERQDKLQAKKEEKCSSAGLSMPIDIVMERARCHLDGSDYATMAIDTMEGRLLSLA